MSEEIINNIEKPIWQKIVRDLGKLPMFEPVYKRIYQEKTFNTPWGTVVKKGHTLTMYDEDILIAILNRGKFKVYETKDGEQIQTIVWEGTRYELLKQALKKQGSKSYDELEKSLDNLANQNFKINILSSKNSFSFQGNLVIESTLFEDVTSKTNGTKNSGLFKIIVNAKISTLFFNSTTKINISLRNNLSPVGKSLHRVLSCHHNPFISIKNLRLVTAPGMTLSKFRYAAKSILQNLGYRIKNDIVSLLETEDKNLKTLLETEDKTIGN